MLKVKNVKYGFYLLLILMVAIVYLFFIKKSGNFNINKKQHIENSYFVKNLQNNIDNIKYINIKNLDKDLLLKKDIHNNNWFLENRDNYPVDSYKVLELIKSIANLKIVEAKTNDPNKLHQLSLLDPNSELSDAIEIKLSSDLGSVANILFGKREGLQLRDKYIDHLYVRNTGESQVWLVKGELPRSFALTNFVEQFFTEISVEDIKSLVLESGIKDANDKEDKSKNLGKFVLEKDYIESLDYKILGDYDQEHPEKEQYLLNMIPKAITNINFYDIIDVQEENKNNFDWDKSDSVTITTFDNLFLEIKFLKQDDKYILKISKVTISEYTQDKYKKLAENLNSYKDKWNYLVSESDLSMLFNL